MTITHPETTRRQILCGADALLARMHAVAASLTVVIVTTGCASAWAERPSSSAEAAVLVEPEAAYDVSVLDEAGYALRTYAHHGRYYVLGHAGERYAVRVANATGRRIEAVVSVDGLDVIDGQPGSLGKRGYVVPAGGEVVIEGFRTSTRDLAAFRFSSVRNSYAGRRGMARNVGVIGVAIFDERPAAVIARPEPPLPPPYTSERFETSSAAPPAQPSARSAVADEAGPSAGAAARSSASHCCIPSRPGLGTAYGEQRVSHVSFTRFMRASDVPVAQTELRYNDAAGLARAGVLAPGSADDTALRETAEPFPSSFAPPPQ